ncbi:MAG: carboxymuconolactone decarboxylase family protein [Saprospiraceae bacterium]|nr:carboxymuconolactone decarboxylase family protein [Saprospiraceae bacterium]
MSWIKTINYEDAGALLKRIYDRVKGPNNSIDNVLLVHSLRPHSLVGHMTLYKSVLHHVGNELPKWYLESIGVYVSHLNKCHYCVKHHQAGLKRLLNDDQKAELFLNAVVNDTFEEYFDTKYMWGMKYAKKITEALDGMCKDDIEALKTVGFSEGEILEINQVASYFNYVNRTVVGLGVVIDGDELGLSPNNSGDPKNWNHQ